MEKTNQEEKQQEKTITQLLQEIADDFCENYCKYPDVCMSERKDPDEAEDLLYSEYCNKACPFNRL